MGSMQLFWCGKTATARVAGLDLSRLTTCGECVAKLGRHGLETSPNFAPISEARLDYIHPRRYRSTEPSIPSDTCVSASCSTEPGLTSKSQVSQVGQGREDPMVIAVRHSDLAHLLDLNSTFLRFARAERPGQRGRSTERLGID
ncbi:hypothetical protein L209DRAFT_326166 [Thermothelomyces heterothallicus CBS 203.75]